MNPLSVFREFKKIYGICPCCGELFRLSDADVYSTAPSPRTTLDDLTNAQRRLDQKFMDLQGKLDALKNQATEVGRQKARRRLRKLAHEFVSRHIDPNDVKVLFDPVRFIAFSGMSVETVKSVCFLDRPAASRRQERVQQSVERSLARGNVEWVTLRVNDDGTVVRE